jgi:hypothetical protein
LTADIRMPDFGLKFHDWRPERVFRGDANVDKIGTALVGSPRRTTERSSQMGKVVITTHSLRSHLGVGIGMDVRNLLCNAAGSVRRHDS